MPAKLQAMLGSPAARMLLVEDSPEASAFIHRALGRVGLHVTIAATGERALELADLEPFDLVLLDLSSSRLCGLEVCRSLRKEPATRDLPLVCVVAWDTSKATVDEARQLGVAQIISKPFHALEFAASVLGSLRQQARETDDVIEWAANR